MDIAIIGAGSHFTLHLLRALYQAAPRDDSYHLRFMDIRREPLDALDHLIPRLNRVTRATRTEPPRWTAPTMSSSRSPWIFRPRSCAPAG